MHRKVPFWNAAVRVVLICKQFIYFLADQPDVFCQIQFLTADNEMTAAIDWNQNLFRFAGSHSGCDSRGDLSQKGVGQYNADGTNDKVRILGIDDCRVFPGSSISSTRLHHGGGSDAVGADGI